MEPLRHQFLARAPFPDDEHGAVKLRRATDPLNAVKKGRGLADKGFSSIHFLIFSVFSYLFAIHFIFFQAGDTLTL